MKNFAVPIMLLVFLSAAAFAASQDSITANQSLKSAEMAMEKMSASGLPISRYNDTLVSARQLYEAQYIIESSGKPADYSLFYKKLKEAEELSRTEYHAFDELKALKSAINLADIADKREINAIYSNAKMEFESERYDGSQKLVSQAYVKLSEAEALRAKIQVVYDAASRGIFGFLKENQKKIAVILIVLGGFLIMAYNRIVVMITKRKIDGIEKRIDSVKLLIGKTQKEYFEQGNMSEVSYNIRIKKYGDLIRNLNRKLLQLKEVLIRKEKRKDRKYESIQMM